MTESLTFQGEFLIMFTLNEDMLSKSLCDHIMRSRSAMDNTNMKPSSYLCKVEKIFFSLNANVSFSVALKDMIRDDIQAVLSN